MEICFENTWHHWSFIVLDTRHYAKLVSDLWSHFYGWASIGRFIYLWITYAMPSTILFFYCRCQSWHTYISYISWWDQICGCRSSWRAKEVPCLGAEDHKFALKYVYKYRKCRENFQGIKIEETSYKNLD